MLSFAIGLWNNWKKLKSGKEFINFQDVIQMNMEVVYFNAALEKRLLKCKSIPCVYASAVNTSVFHFVL